MHFGHFTMGRTIKDLIVKNPHSKLIDTHDSCPRMNDSIRLSSSLTYSPILVSLFSLYCLSLSAWLKTQLAHYIPHKNRIPN